MAFSSMNFTEKEPVIDNSSRSDVDLKGTPVQGAHQRGASDGEAVNPTHIIFEELPSLEQIESWVAGLNGLPIRQSLWPVVYQRDSPNIFRKVPPRAVPQMLGNGWSYFPVKSVKVSTRDGEQELAPGDAWHLIRAGLASFVSEDYVPVAQPDLVKLAANISACSSKVRRGNRGGGQVQRLGSVKIEWP